MSHVGYAQGRRAGNLPEAEHIANTNMNQQNQPATCSALKSPTNNQHQHSFCRRTDCRASKEHGKGQKDDQLAPPDIR